MSAGVKDQGDSQRHAAATLLPWRPVLVDGRAPPRARRTVSKQVKPAMRYIVSCVQCSLLEWIWWIEDQRASAMHGGLRLLLETIAAKVAKNGGPAAETPRLSEMEQTGDYSTDYVVGRSRRRQRSGAGFNGKPP